MKFFRTLAPVLLSACLLTSTAFAAPGNPNAPGIEAKHQKCEDFSKDPVKALESKKERIQSRLKEGKISKEKADAITARIDAKIKEVNEFNKLTPPQKKAKLINDFKTSMERRVKEGKLTRENADTILKDFTEKVNQWDGNGYPKFHGKGFKGKDGHHGKDSEKNLH